MRTFLLTYFLFFITIISAESSHIVGGDFSLTHLEEDNYELAFEVFRDCYHGEPYFNVPAFVGMYEKETHELVKVIPMDMYEDDTLDFVDEGCIDIPENCTHVGRYSEIIELEAGEFDHPGGYYFSWERCCRNIAIDNIQRDRVQPYGSEGIAFYMEVPPMTEQPSSPAFTRSPMTLLCVGNSFNFDFSATNPDDDSLVYSLIEPIKGNLTVDNMNHHGQINYPVIESGPYEKIDWQDGYSLDNIMDGEDGMSINSETGEVQVSPTRQGIYAVAIKVEYFEDGEKRGEVIRELQFNVTSCLNNTPPEFGKAISEDTVYEVYANQELEIPVEVTDPDEGDSVYLDIEGTIFDTRYTGPQVAEAPSDAGLNQAESYISWSPSCDMVREKPYTVHLRAEDNGCPQSMRSFEQVQIKVLPPPPLEPPEVLCVERVDESRKIIEWKAFNNAPDLEKFIKEYRLVKISNEDSQILLRFNDQDTNRFVDNNAPVGTTDDECYILIAIDICGKVSALPYKICSEDELEDVENITVRNATVIENEAVEVFWQKADEDPFRAYDIYRKKRDVDEPFQWYTRIYDRADTSFVDSNVEVDSESYCYKVEVSNACGYKSTLSQKGCQIVLDGVSEPFEHILSWHNYIYWQDGVDRYELWRKFPGNKEMKIAEIAPGGDMKWVDDTMQYDEGAYYYKVQAVKNRTEEEDWEIISRSNEIFLYQDPILYVPNAFSPNDDDVNDEWEYKPVFVKELHLQIYSRWGELLYETRELDGYWDGKIDGELAEETAFVYRVVYRGWDGRHYTERGTINTLR